MTSRLEVVDLRVRLGSHDAVRGVSLDVAAGSVLGLVGPNGAGKTTLVDAVSGFVAATGAVRLDGQPIDHLPPHGRAAVGLSRTFQSLELFEDLTVGENLAVAAETGGRHVRAPAEGVIDAATVAGVSDVLDALPASLSTGRRKQVAFGRALAVSPKVLLLDEPAAGLDQHGRTALAEAVQAVAADGVAVIVVDHDVGLVLEMCDEVAVLDGGVVVTRARPAQVRSDPSVSAAWMGRSGDTLRSGGRSPARTAVDDGRPLLELAGLSTGYRGAPVVSDVDLVVAAGEVVALLGANGAGKTTTLLAASGALPPLAGEVRVFGHRVRGRPDRVVRQGAAHAPQDRGVLHSLTVSEQLRLAAGPGRRRSGGRGDEREAVLDLLPGLRPLLARRAGLLSGGEQQMLSLARALAGRPRLLLIDELSLGLAPGLVESLLDAVRAAADRGAGVLLVEQFAPLALSVADRAYVLDRGRVAAEGPAGELASRPEVLAAAYLGPRADGAPGADLSPGA